ncbi:MAG: glutathione peroxidase [Pedobacter sp.]|nr:MAG: glutathione peroxidase [Pedobacter sp.]
MKPNIYPIQVSTLNGKTYDLSKYKGQVVLIVNIASGCGFTPQLTELEKLYQEFKDQGFVILGFPSNDFGNQEPLDNAGIESFCQLNYGVNFPLHEKILVRGAAAHPLFKFLSEKSLNGAFNSIPRWNFHKYLINRQGEVVDYFYTFTKPDSSRIRKKVKKLLALNNI